MPRPPFGPFSSGPQISGGAPERILAKPRELLEDDYRRSKSCGRHQVSFVQDGAPTDGPEEGLGFAAKIGSPVAETESQRCLRTGSQIGETGSCAQGKLLHFKASSCTPRQGFGRA